jgi:hypothetical protein
MAEENLMINSFTICTLKNYEGDQTEDYVMGRAFKGMHGLSAVYLTVQPVSQTIQSQMTG